MHAIQVRMTKLELSAEQISLVAAGAQLAWPAVSNRVSMYTYYVAGIRPDLEVRKTRDKGPIRLIGVEGDDPFEVSQLLLSAVEVLCRLADESDELNSFQVVVSEPVMVPAGRLIYCNIFGAGVHLNGGASVV